MTSPEIKIEFAALEDRDGTIVLRGSIGTDAMRLVRIGEYQRELLPLSSRASILDGIKGNEIMPAIELGMRGQRFTSKGTDWLLKDDIYCMDGQQRMHTAMEYAAAHPHANVRLGCCIHFDTNEAYERDKFHTLNAHRVKVAPSVLLRNARDKHRPVLMLYGLTHQAGFVLHDRVCWKQNKQRNHLLTALTCLKIMCVLHNHLAPGHLSTVKDLLAAVTKMEAEVGIQNLRDNTAQFWNLIDECFGVRNIDHNTTAPHLLYTFLSSFARMLSNHSDFWRNRKQLFVDATLRRKIAQFRQNLQKEDVRRVCGSSGAARELIYAMLVNHINHGKRDKKLVPWGDEAPRKPRSPKTASESARAPA